MAVLWMLDVRLMSSRIRASILENQTFCGNWVIIGAVGLTFAAILRDPLQEDPGTPRFQAAQPVSPQVPRQRAAPRLPT
jgi:hypothetical protein